MAYLKMYGGQLQSVQSYRTMTVMLDLTNSDPTSWATYADDAIGLTPVADVWDEFFGHYPCILDNGVELGKLKRTDFTKYEDNTSAPITTLGKDVMICFPKRGIKLEKSRNNLSISMTDEPDKTGFSYLAHSYKGNACDKFYLGAYEGYVASNKLYSVSGQIPSGDYTIGNFRSYAQTRGTGYEQSAFYQLTFRQVIYLLKYKGQNAQLAVGRGFVDGNSAKYGACGYTNNKGMDWGENTGKLPMKLLGLENFYGDVDEYIDGIYASNDGTLLAADGNYNDTGSGYVTVSGGSSRFTGLAGYMRYPVGTNAGGFAPLLSSQDQNYGTSSTYFCDHVSIKADQLAYYGGDYSDADIAGVFRFALQRTAIDAKPYYGARLMYMHVA